MKKIFIMFCFLFCYQNSFADQVKYIAHSETALASFIDIIRTAKKEIDLTTFIFEPCHASTQVLLNELSAKAKNQNVKVRLLLDAFMHSKKQKSQLAAFALRNNIELKFYSDSIFTSNNRSHIKLIIADSEKYITGGRNIADDYFGLYYGHNFIDRDVYVKGDSAKQAKKGFDSLWNSRKSTFLKVSESIYSGWNNFCEENKSKLVSKISQYMEVNRSKILSSVPTRVCSNAKMMMDSPGAIFVENTVGPYSDEAADRVGKYTTAEILRFIDGTKNKLVFENWSFMTTDEMKYRIHEKTFKKIPMLVITNDNMDGPGVLKSAEDYSNLRSSKFMNSGTMSVLQVSMEGSLKDSWLMSPPSVKFRLHGKVIIRDSKDVIVSSLNIDARSMHLNLESLFLAENCKDLANDVNGEVNKLFKVFQKDVANGVDKNKPNNKLGLFLSVIGHSFF